MGFVCCFFFLFSLPGLKYLQGPSSGLLKDVPLTPDQPRQPATPSLVSAAKSVVRKSPDMIAPLLTKANVAPGARSFNSMDPNSPAGGSTRRSQFAQPNLISGEGRQQIHGTAHDRVVEKWPFDPNLYLDSGLLAKAIRQRKKKKKKKKRSLVVVLYIRWRGHTHSEMSDNTAEPSRIRPAKTRSLRHTLKLCDLPRRSNQPARRPS